MSKNPSSSQQPELSLEDVLRTNQKVSSDVKDAAEELEIVHAVLDSKVPENARAGDVGAAIDRTELLEKKLKESTAQLDIANAALQQANAKLAGGNKS
jgi:hypothetical protein